MMISGNGFLLKAVFRNLLKNAVKYGAEGGIVSIGLRKHGCFLRINIHNHGRPVPKEYRDRLFNKFSTIPKHGKHNQDGMGLGLFLVKEIIHKEGGRIWYEATDHGSNFVFILPQNR
jgi:two-component system phosphate regulon sensor histidine kinase PhoR